MLNISLSLNPESINLANIKNPTKISLGDRVVPKRIISESPAKSAGVYVVLG